MKNWVKNTSGNMTMLLGISMFAVVGVIGVAVDFSSASRTKKSLQNYADAAVLAAAASGIQDHNELKTIVDTVVDQNNTTGKDLNVSMFVSATSYLTVKVETDYDTMFMGLFGVDMLRVKALAEAPPRGKSGKVNLALVLDVTGSMEGAKLATLKTSANHLIDFLNTDGNTDSNVLASLVPFASYVKIPTSYKGQPWLEVEPDRMITWQDLDIANSTGCTTTTEPDTESGQMQSHTTCTNPVYITHSQTQSWEGCMGSRPAPYNEQADYNNHYRLQGFSADDWCHDELIPLTDNLASIKAGISALGANQNTYIPAGLTWGWRTLSPGAPFTEANRPDKNSRRNIMVLMTDGSNTQSIGDEFNSGKGRYHWGGDPNAANTLTSRLCNKIKGDGITIYTIAFGVQSAGTKGMLQSCATSPDKFYDAGSSVQLTEAFNNIGEELAQVRLSK